MHMVGYSCLLDGVEVHSWRGKPSYFEYRDGAGKLIFKFKGSRLKANQRGLDGKLYAIVQRHEIDKPTRYHSRGADSSSFDGSKTVVDPNWTPITVTEAKQQRKAEIRQMAVARLSETDPETLRALELGQSVPGQIATRRAAIRQRALEMAGDIDALTTLEQIEAYVEKNWP